MRRNSVRSFAVLTWALLGFCRPASAQVYGCKDPTANNYNSAATVNDGSCTYTTTSYTPPLKVDPISSVLQETSGLQMAGTFLWSFNDGGGDPAIFRIDTLTSSILQAVTLGGATNVDWEDIAFDGTYFYIGDFGNNATGGRTDLKIYRLKLSDIPSDYASNPSVTIPAGQIEVINFTYSDQTPVVATGANNTKFDCEAMIVDDGKIHLFTKDWVSSPATTTHYVINGTSAGDYVATPAETLTTNYLVTAADKAPGKNVVALLGYQVSGTAKHYLYLLSDFSSGLYFNGNKRLLSLPDATQMGQAEGLTFRNGTYGYISNEFFTRTVLGITITVQQRLRSFNTESFLPLYVLPLELKSFSATKQHSGNLVQWDFASPVKNLRLQVSSNRIDYTTVQSVAVSESGRFLHQPAGIVNCYRLVWKKDDGSDAYSDVVCVKNPAQGSLSKLVLRSNGALSFVLGGRDVRRLAFRLLTTDGKLLAQTAQQTVAPGANQIRFAKVPHPDTILLVQAIGDDESHSLLLKVE